MQDETIRKILEIGDAMATAGKRLRESDSVSWKLAELARQSIGLAASERAMLDIGPMQSVLVEFAERDRRAREMALSFAQPLATQDLLERTWRTEVVPGFAIGPLAQMRNAGLFASQQQMLERSFAVSSRMLETFEAGFRIPSAIETVQLAFKAEQNATVRALASVTESRSLISAMEQMKTPWLDTVNPALSSAAFAAIQQMANAVHVGPAFDVGVASALRLELGDWRKPISWPQEIFTDLKARASLYTSLGVSPSLTMMPAAAFQETVEIAGLIDRTPILDEGRFDPGGEDTEEEGFGRTNEAHDQLQRLEVELRRFIDAILFAEYGDEWMKRCVPAATLGEWNEKQQKGSRVSDRAHPLIFYADFTDYERVICRRDNWKHFQPYFGRKESVLESFQRLYPIRIDTMHARLITQDDQLLLLVEYKRLMRALQKLRTKRSN